MLNMRNIFNYVKQFYFSCTNDCQFMRITTVSSFPNFMVVHNTGGENIQVDYLLSLADVS